MGEDIFVQLKEMNDRQNVFENNKNASYKRTRYVGENAPIKTSKNGEGADKNTNSFARTGLAGGGGGE